MPTTYLRARDTVLAGEAKERSNWQCWTDCCSKEKVSGDKRLTECYLYRGAVLDWGTAGIR